GPAGAGKSTVAKAAAQRLGFTYLDTGAMYRCVGLAANRADLAAREVVEGLEIEVGERVLLNGEDVTQAIREPGVSEAASRAAPDATPVDTTGLSLDEVVEQVVTLAVEAMEVDA